MNDNYLPITYSGFYDVPLAFVVHYRTNAYLFRRGQFDDAADDYPESYFVYRITPRVESEVLKDWNMNDLETEELGQISVHEVVFDPTKRRAISDAIFEKFVP